MNATASLASWWQASAVLLAVLLGLYLPLDVIYGLPGVLKYADLGQGAVIFLHHLVLAILVFVIFACLCIPAGAIAGWLFHRQVRKGIAFVTIGLAIGLVAYRLTTDCIVWSMTFFDAPPSWLRTVGRAIRVIAAVSGFYLVTRISMERLRQVFAPLRLSSVVVIILATGSAVVLATNPEKELRHPPEVQVTGDRPPIILITIDTLSALHLPTYGYARATAPRMAEFANGATVFLRNYANSNFTSPTVASIISGYRPWMHRAIHLEGQPLDRLSGESLPTLLRAGGYYTAAVSTNPLADAKHQGVGRYFSASVDNRICGLARYYYLSTTTATSATLWAKISYFLFLYGDHFESCKNGPYDPELAFTDARHMMDQAPTDRPLFLWVHLFPPHDPYIAPSPFVGMFDADPVARDRASTVAPVHFEVEDRDFQNKYQARYDEAIRYVDHHVGKFLDELRRRGLFDKSLVIISADHGESFSKGYGQHSGPLLHEELVRVPLMIKVPGQQERKDVTGLSEQVDMLPTILELAGIQYRHHGEGISLVPAMHGETLDRPAFSMNFEQSSRRGPLDTGTVVMVDGQWKYIHYFGNIRYPQMPRLTDELYDLSADHLEAKNLISEQPVVAKHLLGAIEKKLEQNGGRID